MFFLEQESIKLQQGYRGLAQARLLEAIPGGARCQTDAGVLEASFFAPGVIRLRLTRQNLPDYGLLVSEPQPPAVDLRTDEHSLELRTGEFCLRLSNYPLQLEVRRGERIVLQSALDRTIQGDRRFLPLAYREESWLLALELPALERLYGLGEQFGRLDHRGQLVENWNRDALGVNTAWSYKNVPFVWSTAGWGLWVHTPARVRHGLGYAPWSHRSYVVQIGEPNLDLFFIFGQDPAQMLERYTALTGRSPVPPLWSFGVWYSRAFYRDAEELLQAARTLRERRIPGDVITLDGRAWHKPETRFDFSWDPDRYPNPAAFLERLRRYHLRLCLWEYPYVSRLNPRFAEWESRGYFLKNPDGSTYLLRYVPEEMQAAAPHLQPSGIVDFTNPEAYAWYQEMHRNLFALGGIVMKTDYGEAVPPEAIAWNGDRGERLHNVYAHLYNRCVYETARDFNPEEALVWARAGWSGSQRYPTVWGGDPQGDWQGLAASLRGGLSWGLSGGPFYTSDIGGFTGNVGGEGLLAPGKPDDELYIRWTQAAVFSSHTRFHGVGPREPWQFSPQTEAIVRQWVELRYRLLPYLLSCAQEAAQTGLPVQRAMPLAFPADPLTWNFETQYLFGPALLAAPLTSPGGRAEVYLPEGEWVDFWSGEQLQGPRLLERHCPLEQMPLYVHRGAELPFGPVVQHTGELQPEKLIEEIRRY